MPSNNLGIGQFQLGTLKMGVSTPFAVESIDIGNYDLNVQDKQTSSSSTIDFGQDTFKPAPMQLTINVRKNKQLANVSAQMSNPKILDYSNEPDLADLQAVWRSEDTFEEWGATDNLYFCGTDGITRMFVGRPGKFAYKLHKIVGSQYYNCQAEFRRLDTLAHSEAEWFRVFNPNAAQTVSLARANARSWVRFLITGPANHPIINFGSKQLELDWNITAGQVAEISSYPWSRRSVLNTGISLGGKYIGPYLDKVYLTPSAGTLVSWHATGTSGASKMTLLWHDGYQVLD